MMGVFKSIRTFFSKTDPNPSRKVSILSRSQRKEVEDLIEHGWLAREIAQELGIENDAVYGVKELMRRKSLYHKDDGQDEEILSPDPVAIATKELQAAKIQLAADRIALEREKLEAERQDLYEQYDDTPPIGDMIATGGNVEDQLLGSLLSKVITADRKPAQQQAAIQPPPQNIAPARAERQLSDDELSKLINGAVPKAAIKLIRSGAIGKETALRIAHEKVPYVNNADLERAYEMVMTK